MSEPRCYFFGCWNEPGHYIFGTSDRDERSRLQYVDKAQTIHLDGTLAPRSARGTRLLWGAQFKREERRYDEGKEYPQGQFLRHELETGFTAIQWWDRCQGDQRGACNSTVLLEGRHTSAEMLAALERHFPHVLANLQKHGVQLVEVHVEDDRPPTRWYSQAELDVARDEGATIEREACAKIAREIDCATVRDARDTFTGTACETGEVIAARIMARRSKP